MEENKIKGKCPSCGASVLEEEKACSYCGTINQSYTDPTKKIKKDIDIDEDEVSDVFSDMLGGAILGKALKDLKRDILHPFDITYRGNKK